jgi:hypothetical protein
VNTDTAARRLAELTAHGVLVRRTADDTDDTRKGTNLFEPSEWVLDALARITYSSPETSSNVVFAVVDSERTTSVQFPYTDTSTDETRCPGCGDDPDEWLDV